MKELIKDKKLIEEENDLKKSNNASTLCHQLSERDHVWLRNRINQLQSCFVEESESAMDIWHVNLVFLFFHINYFSDLLVLGFNLWGSTEF